MAELSPGSVFGDFEIEGLVAHGGMGIVYKARQRQLGRLTALKIIAPHLALDEGFRERFRREAQMAAAIDHPNILPIYDAGEIDGQPYLAMRYVEGTDLRNVIDKESPLDPERVVGIMSQVASALDAAHARGLIHRDVKPGNILIDQSQAGREIVYLTDFGLTRGRTDTRFTQTGTWVGTVDYMAPEQFESRQADYRVDQYSLACMMYETFAGTRPFERDSDVQVMFAHIRDEPPAVSAGRPEIPPAVDDALRKGMAKTPEERFGSCSELVDHARFALSMPAGPVITSTGTAPVTQSATVVGESPSGAYAPPPPPPPPAPEYRPPAPPAPVSAEPVHASAPPQFSQPNGAPLGSKPTKKLALIGGGAAALIAGVVAAVALTGGDSKGSGVNTNGSTPTVQSTSIGSTDSTPSTDTTSTPPADTFPPATAGEVLQIATRPTQGVVVYKINAQGTEGTLRVAFDDTRLGIVFRAQGNELRLQTSGNEPQWACARQGQGQTLCFKNSSLTPELRTTFVDTIAAFQKVISNEGLQTLFSPIVLLGPEVYGDRQIEREVACFQKRTDEGLARLCTTEDSFVTDISVVVNKQPSLFRATSLKASIQDSDFAPPAALR